MKLLLDAGADKEATNDVRVDARMRSQDRITHSRKYNVMKVSQHPFLFTYNPSTLVVFMLLA